MNSVNLPLSVKSEQYIMIVILLCLFSFHTIAQDAAKSGKNKKDTIAVKDEWQKGYLVLNTSSDTLFGFLNIKTTMYGDIKKILFRKKKEEKEGTLKFGDMYINKNRVIYLGLKNKRYRYIDYEDKLFPAKVFVSDNNIAGWCEIIEEGPIVLCKGFHIVEAGGGGGGVMTLGAAPGQSIKPMYYLKKGDAPAILVGSKTISILKKDDYMKYEMTDKNKTYLISYIADDKELAEKVKNGKVLFGEIEKIVSEYNIWAKNQ